ncbi:MAG: ribosome-binding factor A [Desulfobulbus propionicus]|nr:MAG: ribosome-binding factor A [Desulfobulbus propionicus]
MDFDFTLPGLGKQPSSRPKRVAEAIKNELSVLLLQKTADPRLEGVTISEVEMSPDLKRATVRFFVPKGTDREVVKKAVTRAKGFFRGHIARTLNLRYTPELVFFHDTKQDELARLDALFEEIDRERRR